ncbi:MAG: queG [Gammaproteobacteria bacterium]|nr:queG [Gammaproteobacteria bacterium]
MQNLNSMLIDKSAVLPGKAIDFQTLTQQIKAWGLELGFQQIGITGVDLSTDAKHLDNWLHAGRHGEMTYMSRHGSRRSRPQELVQGTLRVISARMDYFPPDARLAPTVLADQRRAYISRYALGRDYHRLLRKRLQDLADRISDSIGTFGYRAFVDSAPVLEKALARNAGLGWIGKHSNLINPKAGSWFFLGELYTDLPLPVDEPFVATHCGSCQACLDVCPTRAIVAPYQVDARRCISYLTIELKGPIPLEFRKAMGNRIFGCDDCQLLCPWNRFAKPASEAGFRVRHGLDAPELVSLFQWSREEFFRKTEGSAIRRIGYERWLRNIAVALGNAVSSGQITAALAARAGHESELVREHVQWALSQHVSN